MPDTGFVFPSSGTTVGANTDWTNPGNITADDASNATCSLSALQTSDYLLGSSFGFSLSTGSTVNGIDVTVEATHTGDLYVANVALTKNGTSPVGTSESLNVDGTTTFGGASSLWGTTWTEAEVEDSTFGVMINFAEDLGASGGWQVDYVKVKIHYTEGGGGSPATETLRVVTAGLRW